MTRTKTTIQLTANNWKLDSEGEGDEERFTLEATLCAVGPIRNRANQDTDIQVTYEPLDDARQRGLFDNLACFVDHESFWGGNGTMPRLCGAWGDSFMSDQGVKATLYFYTNQIGRDTAETFKNIMADAAAGRPVPDVGVSVDFYASFDHSDDGYVLEHIEHVTSADLVFMPASVNSRIDGAKLSLSATFEILEEDGVMPPEENQEEGVVLSAPVVETELTVETEVLDMSADVARFNAQMQQIERLNARALQREIAAEIREAGLPAPVVTTLLQRTFSSLEDAQTAIADAQAIWSAAIENNVVQMGSMGQRGSDIRLTTPLDQAADIVNWLFGLEAPTPEPEMRRWSSYYRGMTGDLEINGRPNPANVRFAGANTTELANLAEDALNKVLVIQWEELGMYRWYEFITAVIPNDGSLHDIKMSQIASNGTMPTIAEGGAFTEGTIDDKKEQFSFVNKGKFIGITRTMVKNDDIDGIRRIPMLIAQDAVFARSDAIAALFTTASGVGPDLQDTNPLFHSSRGNVATTAFSESAWEAAALECANQSRFFNSRKLGIMPKYALVPVALWYTARKAFGYGDGVPTTYSPFAFQYSEDDPRPIPLAVPNWTDANDWAYAVDPNMQRHICMSYSAAPQGGSHPRPQTAVLAGSADYTFFNDKVMAVRVMDEAAVGVADGVGLGKRNVA